MDKRDVKLDRDLHLEAYFFDGLNQVFPNHFHEYYVLGLVESGERRLTVKNREYPIGPGDMLTFNPMDNHACVQTDSGRLTYRCINIKQMVMEQVFKDIGGSQGRLPHFILPVIYHADLAGLFRELHELVMQEEVGLHKEEVFLLLMRQLCVDHAEPVDETAGDSSREEIEEVCRYLEDHYNERVGLDAIAALAHLNKYTLLRTFARVKGITPYRYLETIRIGKAKQMLERGLEPAEVAQLTGFSDQSHFTRFFRRFIGLSPKQYQSIFMD